MEDKIWYCSYGSNLSFERFKIYILGGSSPIVNKVYGGCTNQTLPQKRKFIKIPYEMYFAGTASFWENLSVAFISPDKNPNGIFTNCCAYLISMAQFHDIVNQENAQFANSSTFTLDIQSLLQNGSLSLGSKKENEYYGKILYLGDEEGYPVITFSSKWSFENAQFNKPGKQYLKTIISGLRESGALDKKEIVDYFKDMRGIKNAYSTHDLNKIVDDVISEEPKKLIVQSTRKANRNGDFTVQLQNNFFRKSNWCLLKRADRLVEIQAKIEYVDKKEISNEVIRMDQKLRCALSTNKGDSILIYPILRKNKKFLKNKSNVFTNLKAILFGTQINLVRVKRASYNDMEINACRIKRESMHIIGVEPGDFIVVESPYHRMKVRALEITADIQKEMDDRARKNKSVDFNCSELLNIKRIDNNLADLQPILLDYDTRVRLKVGQCAPIRIRRSLAYEIRKRLHYISTPLILTILAALISFNFNHLTKILILAMGAFLIVLLLFINIKINSN